MMAGTPFGGFVQAVTPAGLAAAGAWPSPGALLIRLHVELDHLAAAAELSSPEKASKVRQLAGAITSVAKDIGEDLLVKSILQAAGHG
jgi:hypothetical protein